MPRVAMQTENEKAYLGERLFHFWPHNPGDIAFDIFISIAERGLLLSRGNKGLIDRFPYVRKDGQIDYLEVVQNARVCFTDIPEDKLAQHCEEYGKCAVGFTRGTILAWGGCPVWYLPNHVKTGTLQEQAGSFLYGLADAIRLLNLLPRLLEQTGNHLTWNGEKLSPTEAWQKVELSRQSLLRMSSFLKEMSGKLEDDHRYLYEREWRIVSGITSDKFGSPFRKLTDFEKAKLVGRVPAWGKPMEANDPVVTKQLSSEPLIDSFYFFNGISAQETVSRAIEMILVPDEPLRKHITNYIDTHQDRFRPGGPEVRLLAGLNC